MAQTGFTPIQLYYSSTTTNVPLAADLANGELAINITDGKLFYKDNANAVQVIGWKVVPATAGGTGQTSYAVGDLIYANTTTTLAKLPDVATGNALISGGVGVAPSWGKIGLTTHVSGTLPTANGGTNLTSFTANGVVYASSTSALTTGSGLQFDGNNLGVGLAANAWAAGKAVEIGYSGNAIWGVAAANDLRILSNAYFNGTNYKYANNGYANMFSVGDQAGQFNWYGAPSGTAGNNISGANQFSLLMRLDPTTFNLKLTTGNFEVGTSGKGIDFSATPGTGTSELLSDYEEGTWTPTDVSGAGLSLGGSGEYTKIGNMVKAGFSITYPVTASALQNFVSLPVNSNGGGGFFVTYTTFGSAISGYIDGTNNRFVIVNFSGTALTNAALSTVRIDGVLIYRAS